MATIEIGPVTVRFAASPQFNPSEIQGMDAMVQPMATLVPNSGIEPTGPPATGHALEGRRRIFVTPGDPLPFRYVLHVMYDRRNSLETVHDRSLRYLAREVFGWCENLNFRNVAIVPPQGESWLPDPVQTTRCFLEVLSSHVASATILDRITVFLNSPQQIIQLLRALKHSNGIVQIAGVSADTNAMPSHAYRAETDRTESTGEDPPAPTAARSLPPMPSRVGWNPFRRRKPKTETTKLPERDRQRQIETRDELETRDPILEPVAPGSSGEGALGGLSRPVISNRFVLLQELGRGGQGIVYQAWDLMLRRIVAIKTLRPDVLRHPGARERMKKEAELCVGLSHDGIVRVYDYGEDAREIGPFIVMEYLDWDTGERWINEAGRAGLPTRAVVDVGLELCRVLEYAHGRGILHSDIKPQNVFIDHAARRVKLGDFGLARITSGQTRQVLTLGLAGTLPYMAPEQMEPGARIGIPSDVYQLAATMWDFLTGAPPSEGLRPRPDLSERLIQVLRSGLDSNPDRRPQSAGAFGSLLEVATTGI